MSNYACDEEVDLEEVESGEGCDEKGVASVFVIGRSKIDKGAMSAAAALTAGTYVAPGVNRFVLKDWAFTGVTKFVRYGFDIEQSFYESDQADENSDIWTHILTNFFKGKSAEQTLKLAALSAQCGGLILQVFTQSCQSRVFGIEWNSKAKRFDWFLEGMKKGRSKDTHGKFGQDDKARDDFDFVGRSRGMAMWWKDGDEADFITNYTI
jgi:hypothetical protein